MPTENELREWLSFWGDNGVYPFTEDENANITGYGHQDKREFAAGIVSYDLEMGALEEDEREETLDEYVKFTTHTYALADPDDDEHFWVAGYPLRPADAARLALPTAGIGPETPGAFPVTLMWGVR